ncbi:hypothetical protein [Mycolicibacterium vanbaalenii]|uniref:hypothetical protein n=1 Tax=Mycolicibacterium vanbaalenii TaxID=110539 RepID=UPI0023BB13D3|nr:hypothetical protein [Mycolicibacterium vanbaalenii]
MQQALPVAFGAATRSLDVKSASRVNKYLVAGAAMVCAGAIAVNPVAPTNSMPDIRQAAVQLTASTNPVLENPLLVWQNVFTNSFTQAGAIGTALWNNPFPILNQIGENQVGHLKTIWGMTAAEAGTRRGTGLVGAAEGVQRSLTNLPVRLQAAGEFLAAGQFTEALVELNTWALVAMENLAFPLTSLLTIPKAMFDAVGRVYDSLITRGNIITISKGLMSPPITAFFAAMNVADTVFASVKEGNLRDAFTALVNAPGLITGAFLNGYKPYFGHDEEGNPIYSPENFPGLFSAGGTLDALFVKLPQTIAAALKKPVVPAVTSTSTPATSALVTLDVPGATPAEVTPVSSTTEQTPETDPAAGAVADEETEVPAEPGATPEAEDTTDPVVDETTDDVVENEIADEVEDTTETEGADAGAADEDAADDADDAGADDESSAADSSSDSDAGSDTDSE